MAKKSIFKFNEHDILESLEQIGNHVWEYAESSVECAKELAEFELELEILKSELGAKLRKSKGGKATERELDDYIASSEEYQALKIRIINAEYDTAMAKAAIKGLDKTSSSMELWVKMFGHKRFSADPDRKG